MSLLNDDTCPYCDSTIYHRSGEPHCSGDNLANVKETFISIIQLESTYPEHFQARLLSLQEDEYLFDLFMGFWTRYKKDPNSGIKCPYTGYEYSPFSEDRLPMPDPYIPFPDLVEVYIAEIMLGRELTELEKDGSRTIPKINEKGVMFFAPLTWTIYPHGYMSLKDMRIKTDYDAPPAEVIFDIEAIRGICSGRRGDIVDD